MRKNSGFTLLEIMIAVAVIGGLLVSLVYTLNYHLAIAGRHEFMTVATVLARNKIVEMEASPSPQKGDFPPPHEQYRFEADVREAPFPGIAEILVTVKKGSEAVTITQFIEKGRTS